MLVLQLLFPPIINFLLLLPLTYNFVLLLLPPTCNILLLLLPPTRNILLLLLPPPCNFLLLLFFPTINSNLLHCFISHCLISCCYFFLPLFLSGDDYPSAEALLNAVLTLEEDPEAFSGPPHDWAPPDIPPPQPTPSPTRPTDNVPIAGEESF